MLSTDLQTSRNEKLLDEVSARWRDIGLSTQPANREKSEAAVRELYAANGMPPPVMLWLGSPRAAATVVRLLKSDLEWPEDLNVFQRKVWEDVFRASVRQIESRMGADKWAQIRSGIKKRAIHEIESRYGQYMESQVKIIFAERLGIAAWRYLREMVGNPLHEKLRIETEERAKSRIGKTVSSEVSGHLYQRLVPQLTQQVWQPVAEPLRIAIAANNGILQTGVQQWNCSFGLHDAPWIAYYDFLARAGVIGGEPLEPVRSLAEHCGWWWPYENLCLLSERPNILKRDNRGRLHNENGMAVGFPDGWGLYAWNGILVPEDVIVLSEPISFERIEAEPNAEIRRVLIERFGLDNYLRAGKCLKLHQDETGTLYRMNLPGDEPILVVQVINSTAEPDGSFNEYFLRVPPGITRARQGVAWTFGLSEDEYYPLAES
jgi:hypothetical protein